MADRRTIARKALHDELVDVNGILEVAEEQTGEASELCEMLRDHIRILKNGLDEAGAQCSPKELAEECASAVNTFGFSSDEFTETMARQHKTLQQSFTRLCVDWLKYLADTENYDGRNEASVMFARSIKKEIEEAALPFI